MEHLAETIKKLRIEKGATQKELAEYCEVNATTIQRLEYGTVTPTVDTVRKLSKYFDVSTDYLLGLTDNPERNL